jgi:hypothetical protein
VDAPMAHPLTFTAEIGRSAAAAAAVDAMHLASFNDDLAHTCADLNNIMYISKDTFYTRRKCEWNASDVSRQFDVQVRRIRRDSRRHKSI